MPNISDLDVSESDIQRVKTDPESQARLAKYTAKYKKPTRKELRKRTHAARLAFIRENWIQLLGLLFAAIAAAPVIVRAIQAMLAWLEQLN